MLTPREEVLRRDWSPRDPEELFGDSQLSRILAWTYPTPDCVAAARWLNQALTANAGPPLLIIEAEAGWGKSHTLKFLNAASVLPGDFERWLDMWHVDERFTELGRGRVIYTDLERERPNHLWVPFFHALGHPELEEVYGDYLNFPLGSSMLSYLGETPLIWLLDNLSSWVAAAGRRAPSSLDFLRSLVVAAERRGCLAIAVAVNRLPPELLTQPMNQLSVHQSPQQATQAVSVIGHRLFSNWPQRRGAISELIPEVERFVALYEEHPTVAALLNPAFVKNQLIDCYPFHPDLVRQIFNKLSEWQTKQGELGGFALGLQLLAPALRLQRRRMADAPPEMTDSLILASDIDLRDDDCRQALETRLGPAAELTYRDIELCAGIPLAAEALSVTLLYTSPEAGNNPSAAAPIEGATYAELMKGILRPQTRQVAAKLADALKRMDQTAQNFLFDERLHRYRIGHMVMGPMQHLRELRRRIISVGIGFAIAVILCIPFGQILFAFLAGPLLAQLPDGSRLVYTDPPEAFLTYLRASLIAGLLLSAPYIFYQFWGYLDLFKTERKRALRYVAASSGLLLLGAAFGFLVAFPVAFGFFIRVADSDIATPMLRMGSYLSFSLKLLVAFAIVFQVPLIINFLATIGLITSTALRRYRRVAIVACTIIGAILTPPDVLSQVLLAGPLIALYELGILLAARHEKRK